MSLNQSNNHEPVLARGIGRLTLEFTAHLALAARFDYAGGGNSSAKLISLFLPR